MTFIIRVFNSYCGILNIYRSSHLCLGGNYLILGKNITKLKITPVFVDFGQPTKVDENSYFYDSKNDSKKVLDDQSFEIKIR